MNKLLKVKQPIIDTSLAADTPRKPGFSGASMKIRDVDNLGASAYFRDLSGLCASKRLINDRVIDRRVDRIARLPSETRFGCRGNNLPGKKRGCIKIAIYIGDIFSLAVMTV